MHGDASQGILSVPHELSHLDVFFTPLSPAWRMER